MTVAEFIAETYLAATGKVSTLTSSDADWTKIIALGNRFKNEWARTPGVDWVSQYSPAVDCGTVSATDTFDLDSSIYKISQENGDSIRINFATGTNYSDWTLVKPDQLKHYTNGNYVAQVGRTLKFNKTFASTNQEFGGTINVPAYLIPDDMSVAGEDVEVDDPEWLAVRSAAEYVRTDITRQAQYPNLITVANELLQKMIENNGGQVETVPRQQAGYGGRTW